MGVGVRYLSYRHSKKVGEAERRIQLHESIVEWERSGCPEGVPLLRTLGSQCRAAGLDDQDTATVSAYVEFRAKNSPTVSEELGGNYTIYAEHLKQQTEQLTDVLRVRS